MKSTRSSSSRSRVIALAVAFTTLIAAGATAWTMRGPKDHPIGCSHLMNDVRIKTLLGANYNADSTCAQLGKGLRDATVGKNPGEHLRKQAEAMRSTMLALHDSLYLEKGISESLREPIAGIIADYAPDIFEILAHRDLYSSPDRSDPVWQEEDGIHVSVEYFSTLRVMKYLSASPHAYAEIRTAITERAAEKLAATPKDAKGENLTAPAVDSSLAFGSLDGIFQVVGKKFGEAWERAVSEKMTAHTSEIPEYDEEPQRNISQTWLAGLANSKDISSYLASQGVKMMNHWSARRTGDFPIPVDLEEKCRSYEEGFAYHAASAMS